MTARLLESPFGMRWTTLAMAVAIVVMVGAWRRRPVIAGAVLLAWAGGFEVTFRLFEILRWHQWWGFRDLAWEAAALAGWVVAAHALGVRPSLPWVAVTVTAFTIWFATGYDYNLPQATEAGRHLPIRWSSEFENVVAKTAWGMAYLLGALRLELGPSAPRAPWAAGRPPRRRPAGPLAVRLDAVLRAADRPASTPPAGR